MSRWKIMAFLALCLLVTGCLWFTKSLWLSAHRSGNLLGRRHEGVAPLAELPRGRKAAPVNLETEVGRTYWGDIGPLTFASRLSNMGDFALIAFAPRPLDLAELQSGETGPNLQALLALARRKYRQLEWEQHGNWILLYFGSQEELAQLKKPGGKVPPLTVSAPGSRELLWMLADLWGLQVEVEPALVKARDARIESTRRKSGRDRREQIRRWGQEYYQSYDYSYNEGTTPGTHLTFSMMRPTTLSEVMERAAVTLGGECEQIDKTWILRRHVNGQQIAAEVERLMSELQSEGTSNESEVSQKLVALGPSVIPKLLKTIDPQQPANTAQAVRALSELKATESVPQLLELWGRMKKTKPGESESQEDSPREAMVTAMGDLGDRRVLKIVAKVATDDDEPDWLRMAARRALVKLDGLGSLVPKTERSLAPASRRFRVTLRSTRPTANPTVASSRKTSPLLTKCKDDRGQHWALFQCAMLGHPSDLWLATSPDGRTWEAFYFTGFQVTSYYGGWRGSTASPQQYGLTVGQGAIILSLPNPNPSVTTQRVRVGSRWKYVSKQQPGKPLLRKMTVRELQQDSDHDGLTDLAERRLGTDPHKKDSDGDGIPDDRDANPLVAPSSGMHDRQAVLQLLFTYLFGGDVSEDLLVIHTTQPLRQEFYGYGGSVVPVTDDTPASRVQRLMNARCLHLGGPPSSENTVLSVDGPVCFNESRTRAEVHFWLTGFTKRYNYYRGDNPEDQVALLEKKRGQWLLTKVEDWIWLSARR